MNKKLLLILLGALSGIVSGGILIEGLLLLVAHESLLQVIWGSIKVASALPILLGLVAVNIFIASPKPCKVIDRYLPGSISRLINR